MSNQPTISKQIEEMHQQVREFVENEYPGYKVTCVGNSSETTYAKPLGQMAKFSVDGINKEQGRELICDVMLNSDGEMRVMSFTQRRMRY